jgi:hypothetical protein
MKYWFRKTFTPWIVIRELLKDLNIADARISAVYGELRDLREELANYREGFGRDYEILRSAAQAHYWHNKWEILWKRTHRIPCDVEVRTTRINSSETFILGDPTRMHRIDPEPSEAKVATTLPAQEEDE